MFILAILIIVILGLYVIVGSIRQKKILLNKFVVVLGIIAVGLLLLNGAFNKGDAQQVKPEYYQEIAPNVEDAPYIVQTSSRAYYVATYLDSPQYLTLTYYYYYDRKHWQESDIALPLDKKVYGELTPQKRLIRG